MCPYTYACEGAHAQFCQCRCPVAARSFRFVELRHGTKRQVAAQFQTGNNDIAEYLAAT